MRMTRDEMLEYLKDFDERFYNKDSKEEMKAAVDKIGKLLEKFGIKYHISFNARMNYYGRGEDTSWYYRLQLEEYKYLEVQIGWIEEKSKAYGRSKTRYLRGYRGMFRVNTHTISLNPETGRPWQIGDTKTDPSGCYSVTLTKRGWYSGD
jgi:hypothetical protein